MKLLLGIYGIGVLICLSKLFWTLRRLKRMVSIYPKTKINGVTVVKMPNQIASFSFLGYAFIYKEKIETTEMNQIIAHEKVHIEQRHSIDLIFVQLIAAFLWFNPLIWKLIKSLKTTHEYIVDQKIINTGYSLVEYQALLIRELVSNNSYGLVHNFNLSFIKKRIIMMTNNKSGFSGKIKVALTITCTILLSLVLFQCNSEKIEGTSLESKELSNNDFQNEKFNIKQSIFTFSNNKLFFNEEPCEIKDIKSIVEKTYGMVQMEIDINQNMKVISELQNELRKLDRWKMTYYQRTGRGGRLVIKKSLVLNMYKDDYFSSRKGDLNKAIHDSTVSILNDTEYLKVDLSLEKDHVEDVYNYVKRQIARKSITWVIAEYDDTDSFKKYLINLDKVYDGFEEVYKERSQELYGKDLRDLYKSEYRSELNIVRKGATELVMIAKK
jgi:hypothetical protein